MNKRYRVPLSEISALRDSPMPGDWAQRAACRGKDPELFFPGRGYRAPDVLALCQACPVRQPCAEYALRWPVLGVWAGLTYEERASRRRRERIEKKEAS